MKFRSSQELIKVSSTTQEAQRPYLPGLPLYQLFEDHAHQLIMVDFLKQLLLP